MPVATEFENLEAGATVEDVMEWFDVTREQINAVLEFVTRSQAAPDLPDAVASPLADDKRFEQQVQVGIDQIARGEFIEEEETDAPVERMLRG